MIMFSSQIAAALKTDKHASNYFVGVFPCDKLPEQISYPCCLVANTDPSTKKGQHWVAFHFDHRGNAEYFDSYGNPPIKSELLIFFLRKGKNWIWNTLPLQGLDSIVCGQYCIAYLTKRARGESLYDVIRCYRGQEPGEKDTSMAQEINEQFQITNSQRGGGGGIDNCNPYEGEQHCCSKVECRFHNRLKQAELRMIGAGSDTASFLI